MIFCCNIFLIRIFFLCAWPLILHPTFGGVGSCASKASKYKKKTQIECNILRSQQSSLNHHYKRIEGGATYQDCDKKYVVKAIPEPTFDSEPCASNPENVVDSAKKILDVFYHFCYPYSMIAIVSSSFNNITLINYHQMLW